MKRWPGFFISLEGLDGAGKSTQVASLSMDLRHAGHEVISVRPNDTDLGDLVAGFVLQHRTQGIVDPWTEALLFNAGRVQLLREVVLPALERGAVVIADRYADSTIAYQGGGRGLDVEELLSLHRHACHDIWPDLTFYLRVEHRAAAVRQRAQQLPLDRFEVAPEDFHAAVEDAFDRLAQQNSERIVTVDADRSALAISHEIAEITRARIIAAQNPATAEAMAPR